MYSSEHSVWLVEIVNIFQLFIVFNSIPIFLRRTFPFYDPDRVLGPAIPEISLEMLALRFC